MRSWHLGVTLCALALAACVAPSSGTSSSVLSIETTPSDHACVVPGGPPPVVAWSQLHNPILSYPDAAVKDQALVWAGGRWHMLFSYVTNDSPVPGAEHWGIATAESTDLVTWNAPVPWSDQPGGMASPDVVRSPSGTFVVTYDSPPGESGPTQAKLYYRSSPDLVHFSGPIALASGLHPAPTERLIDPALAWTSKGIVLAYKVGTTTDHQAFEIARSTTGSLLGPWVVVGQPAIEAYGDTFENYELVGVGGHWHLVATSNTFDRPWIFTLDGDPGVASGWLHWGEGHELRIPTQGWDTGAGIASVSYEPDNSAFLCEDTTDGYDYLTYAGSQDLTRFGGWGHDEIGIARSRDLVHWSVPPG